MSQEEPEQSLDRQVFEIMDLNSDVVVAKALVVVLRFFDVVILIITFN